MVNFCILVSSNDVDISALAVCHELQNCCSDWWKMDCSSAKMQREHIDNFTIVRNGKAVYFGGSCLFRHLHNRCFQVFLLFLNPLVMDLSSCGDDSLRCHKNSEFGSKKLQLTRINRQMEWLAGRNQKKFIPMLTSYEVPSWFCWMSSNGPKRNWEKSRRYPIGDTSLQKMWHDNQEFRKTRKEVMTAFLFWLDIFHSFPFLDKQNG